MFFVAAVLTILSGLFYAAMPVICPTCQTARFTAAPGSPDERALAWVAEAPPAASIQSA